MVSVSHSHLGGLGPASACMSPCLAAGAEQLEAGDADDEHVTPFLPVTLPLS